MIYFVTNQTTLFDNDYYTVINIEQSLSILETWNVIQFDIETTGLDCHLSEILCIQFGNKRADIQVVVDCTTINIQLYKHILENKPLIGQNLKFDIKFLYNYSIVPTKVYDTMIVEQLLYLGYEHYIEYNLQAIVQRYLNIYISKEIRSEIEWRGLDTETILYAANDVKYLEDIKDAQLLSCRNKNCLEGARLECDFVSVIAYLEWCGIKLDSTKWKAKMFVDSVTLQNAENNLNNLAISWNNPKFYTINRQGDLFNGFDTEPKCTINWSSSQQVITIAKYLGFDTKILDKKTNEEKDSVMEKYLKKQKGINDEFLKLYFNYQEAAKRVSTYGQNYLNAINPKTGRIHTEFRQLGTTSGRMACGSKKPNKQLAKLNNVLLKNCIYPQLQNLPADKITRSCFVSEKDNYMVSADYSALESRLGADIYNEKAMLDEFLYGDGDMHNLCAKMVFKEELKDVEVKDIKKIRPDLRNKVKAVEFAKQFGGSEYSISDTLGCALKEAKLFSDFYDEGFPGVTAYKKQGSKFIRKHGYVPICHLTGHKMYWRTYDEWKERQKSFTPEFWDNYKPIKAKKLNKEFLNYKEQTIVDMVRDHFKEVSEWERLYLNGCTQGTGAIIIKKSCIEMFKWIVANHLFGLVLLCNIVHDENVLEYPKDCTHDIPNILSQKMEEAAAIYCKRLPIPASSEVGTYWIH